MFYSGPILIKKPLVIENVVIISDVFNLKQTLSEIDFVWIFLLV